MLVTLLWKKYGALLGGGSTGGLTFPLISPLHPSTMRYEPPGVQGGTKEGGSLFASGPATSPTGTTVSDPQYGSPCEMVINGQHDEDYMSMIWHQAVPLDTTRDWTVDHTNKRTGFRFGALTKTNAANPSTETAPFPKYTATNDIYARFVNFTPDSTIDEIYFWNTRAHGMKYAKDIWADGRYSYPRGGGQGSGGPEGLFLSQQIPLACQAGLLPPPSVAVPPAPPSGTQGGQGGGGRQGTATGGGSGSTSGGGSQGGPGGTQTGGGGGTTTGPPPVPTANAEIAPNVIRILGVTWTLYGEGTSPDPNRPMVRRLDNGRSIEEGSMMVLKEEDTRTGELVDKWLPMVTDRNSDWASAGTTPPTFTQKELLVRAWLSVVEPDSTSPVSAVNLSEPVYEEGYNPLWTVDRKPVYIIDDPAAGSSGSTNTGGSPLSGAGFKYKIKLRALDTTAGAAPDYGPPDPFTILLTTPVVDDVTFYISCGTQYLYYYVTY